MSEDRKPRVSGPALSERLHRLRNGNQSAAQLQAALEQAQADLETLHDQGDIPLGSPQCGRAGCNYRRWPAGRYCLFHSVGKDSLAARLQHARVAEGVSAKQKKLLL
jgi:hypothetical protein